MSAENRKKVTHLLKIEKGIQKEWALSKILETDAASFGTKDKPKKFFANACYPYMNGRLHLGHAFNYSKLEFTVRFKRLDGFHCMMPMAMHCTGIPIKACADKIKNEIELYGNPPIFPNENPPEKEEKKQDIELKLANLSKGKKSKLAAKTIKSVYQWNIMKDIGFSDDQIGAFADQNHWISYFPYYLKKDLSRMGCHIDWRRSFITTDKNPFYDSFIRWQFHYLKKNNYIKFGKRYTIFSPSNQQPCMDHERQKGEGVDAQEYLIAKLKIVESPNAKVAEILKKYDKVYMLAATLRPETLYGITNCWVGPKIKYGVFETKYNSVFVCTKRAMDNMSYQNFTNVFGKVNLLHEIIGIELVGSKIYAPLCSFEIVYVLPMMNVLENKGTGIVLSVPSDSPDDYATLTDLIKKPKFAEQYGVTSDMLDFKPVPIIRIKTYGDLSAITLYNELKIVSQNDTEKLKLAKEKCYLKGFEEGVMLLGDFKGKLVKEIKRKMFDMLIAKDLAHIYYEPENMVVSRNGDICVVALCDQWYLDYGNQEWKDKVISYIGKMVIAPSEATNNFYATLDWLHEHACSRSFGLGTRLPWDEQYVIESLSDSTIYMSFYTIAAQLMGNTFNGTAENNIIGIQANEMTNCVWDYIFLNAGYPTTCGIDKKKLDVLKNEFSYWYGVDLRCSGKDLIQNHLCYYIYNHVAMWPDNSQFWPKAIKINGHLLLNNEKMSKSTGNFMTLDQAIDKYSADGMRLCLADAGESLEDCNFTNDGGNAALLKLYNFVDWVKCHVGYINAHKNINLKVINKMQYIDEVFLAQIKSLVISTYENYNKMNFRDAVICGFFEFQKIKDKYIEIKSVNVSIGNMTPVTLELLSKFTLIQIIILSPICPHVCEHLWRQLGQSESILHSRWPNITGLTKRDEQLLVEKDYVTKVMHQFRISHKTYLKTSKNRLPNFATIYTSVDFAKWQKDVLEIMFNFYDEKKGIESLDNKVISMQILKLKILSNKMIQVAMSFVQLVKDSLLKSINLNDYIKNVLKFEEMKIMDNFREYICTNLQIIDFVVEPIVNIPEKFSKLMFKCCPRSPIIHYQINEYFMINISNFQSCTPVFTMKIPVFVCDKLENIKNRIKSKLNRKLTNLYLFYYKDEKLGSRINKGNKTKEDLFEHFVNGQLIVDISSAELRYKSNINSNILTFDQEIIENINKTISPLFLSQLDDQNLHDVICLCSEIMNINKYTFTEKPKHFAILFSRVCIELKILLDSDRDRKFATPCFEILEKSFDLLCNESFAANFMEPEYHFIFLFQRLVDVMHHVVIFIDNSINKRIPIYVDMSPFLNECIIFLSKWLKIDTESLEKELYQLFPKLLKYCFQQEYLMNQLYSGIILRLFTIIDIITQKDILTHILTNWLSMYRAKSNLYDQPCFDMIKLICEIHQSPQYINRIVRHKLYPEFKILVNELVESKDFKNEPADNQIHYNRLIFSMSQPYTENPTWLK
ncbi:hypothetical protein A3Q56_01619 [Intoshia linei]|uniref:leucine--tRNA ligase n=1 Tax=Intoshia linei TaxID=1819745 RepID=A0A177BA91_9BILA|nr:hypothetical protein A3Q56_01619 [Intoshia linei]